MSLKVASKRLSALEVSALQQVGQAQSAFVELLTDAELERLIEVSDGGDQAALSVLWQGLLSLSPEHRKQGERLLRLSWIFDMSKAISER